MGGSPNSRGAVLSMQMPSMQARVSALFPVPELSTSRLTPTSQGMEVAWAPGFCGKLFILVTALHMSYQLLGWATAEITAGRGGSPSQGVYLHSVYPY